MFEGSIREFNTRGPRPRAYQSIFTQKKRTRQDLSVAARSHPTTTQTSNTNLIEKASVKHRIEQHNISTTIMSAPIHMRLATLDDYPVVFRGRDEIRVIEQYDHDETTSPEESITFIKDAIKKGHVWIAILGGEPAGFIWFVRSKKCPFGVDYLDQSTEYIFIDFVWVDPKFRGRRVGNYLYDFAEEYCKRNNIPEIVLDVMPMNPKSVEFHTHIGFKPVCTVFSRKVGKKEDGGQTILPSKL